jgi:hypothetical protein
MPRISGPSLVRNGNDGSQNERAARAEVLVRARRLIALAINEAAAGATFIAFERRLVAVAFAPGRAVLGLFLLASERRVLAALKAAVVRDGVAFRRASAKARIALRSTIRVFGTRRTSSTPASSCRVVDLAGC